MPRLKCGSCDGGKGKGKLLKCLHGLCVACLQQRVTCKGFLLCPACHEETPPPKYASNGVQSLPDVFLDGGTNSSSEDLSGSAKSETVSCEECMEEKPAVSRCSDCSLNFCGTHAAAHTTSRRYHKHDLQDLNDVMSATTPSLLSSSRQPDQYCFIHPSNMMMSYCTQCKDLLCEICESQHNKSHKQFILTIAEAATNIKDRLKIRFDFGVDDKVNKLEPFKHNVSSAIQDLHDQTERVSKDVTDYFNNLVQQVKDREQQLLNDLDNLRNRKLLPLEEQMKRIHLSMTSFDTATELLKSDYSNAGFLEVAQWLEEAADRNDKTLRGNAEPCVEANLKFTPDYQDNVVSLLRKNGRVANATLDVKTSSMTTFTPLPLMSEMKVEIAANDDKGQPISERLAAKAQLRVTVRTPDKQTTEIEPTSRSPANKTLVAKYQPLQIGTHTVMATADDEHLRGSPAEVLVAGLDSFNPEASHRDLTLSNYNTSVSARSGCIGNYRCVLGRNVYSEGQHHIVLRLEGANTSDVFIGMTTAVNPSFTSRTHPGLFAWQGYDHNCFRSDTKQRANLGQPWQGGDTIDLWLNCEQRSLTGRHQPSGMRHTIDNITEGGLRLFVSIYYPTASIHIQ